MLYCISYTTPRSARVRTIELEARSVDDAYIRFHRRFGAGPRVKSIALSA